MKSCSSHSRSLFAIALYVTAGVGITHGAPGDIYNLGTLGGTYSEGWSVNDRGQVAGAAKLNDDTYRAFRYTGTPGSGGGMTDLGTIVTGQSLGHGINSSGQVGGTMYPGNGPPHAFRYTGTPGAGGAMVGLGTGGAFTSSYGRAINDAGQVAGYFEPVGGSNYHAFRYTGTPGSGGGAMVDLGTLGGNESKGWAINNAGQVTGWSQKGDGLTRAFVYTGTDSGGAMVDLGTPGGLESHGLGINNAGQVTGHFDSWNLGFYDVRAFRYTPGPGGGMVDLGTSNSGGAAINDAGFVVGAAGSTQSTGATLWLTDAANTAVNLDAWLDAANPTVGAYWNLSTAYDISNNGLVTGYGYFFDGFGGKDDGYRAYLLDASTLMGVPEPASLAILAVGLPLLIWRNSRQSGTGAIRGAHRPMTVSLIPN